MVIISPFSLFLSLQGEPSSQKKTVSLFWLCAPRKRGRGRKEERLEHAYATFSFLSGSHRLTYMWRREAVYKPMDCLTLLSPSLLDNSSSERGESDKRSKHMWRRLDVIWDTKESRRSIYLQYECLEYLVGEKRISFEKNLNTRLLFSVILRFSSFYFFCVPAFFWESSAIWKT